MRVAAVVVTYNRKKLLLECINALMKQSYELNEILIVDNNSTDNTYEFLQENNILSNSKIKYKRLNENIGGAGGFYEGIKEESMRDYDWIWIMDDDTIPKEDSLKFLVESISKVEENVSFLASTVYGMNNEYMNVPIIDTKKDDNGYASWYRYLKDGLVRIEMATFVSLLINNEAIKKIGYPIKDYFIWGDDTEYTLRLTKNYGPAYFVGKSEVIHKRVIAKSLTIMEEIAENRIKFHYYMIRNNLINKRIYYGKMKAFKYCIKNIICSFKILFNLKCKFKKLKIINIYKAIFDYYLKKYDYNAVRNRFDTNVKYKK